MEKGQIISGIKIEDISSDGDGIGRYEGMAVFVDGAVPGDIVSAEVVKLKSVFWELRRMSFARHFV